MRGMSSLISVFVAVLFVELALAQAPPEFPKPGPEHALLKQLEGAWDATMTMPGARRPCPP